MKSNLMPMVYTVRLETEVPAKPKPWSVEGRLDTLEAQSAAWSGTPVPPADKDGVMRGIKDNAWQAVEAGTAAYYDQETGMIHLG